MRNIFKITGNLTMAVVRGEGTFFKMAASQILDYENVEQNNL